MKAMPYRKSSVLLALSSTVSMSYKTLQGGKGQVLVSDPHA